ncbi:MAG: UDP-3-O-(3-hydroxymyristoyl)glucosamine N-acyltransferase [Elusimicrobiota bacterium]|jgi:UDP-3-O-[3-hydroxymyristoyl] glucosamine N-acyltransferase|nr:UDP-3-O-(3-hydroxymyristoyl)glucosamine N-acyltransferase [Elusimicrobiota bacterium]
MQITSEKLALLVSGELIGNKNTILTGAAGLKQAKENEVSFLGNPKYFSDSLKTSAGVLLINSNADITQFKDRTLIKVPNPQYAYAIVLSIIEKEKIGDLKKEIHGSASISDKAKIGKDAYVGQNVVIEDGAKIGCNAKIFPNVYVGKNVEIGNDCLIYPNVVIREETKIGDRVIIQPNVTIGGDGFGFTTVNGKAEKIPQIGRVEIGNDVEIGSNTTVDRATVDATKIGDRTKIDNLVQIAHNVCIGKNCLIVAQTGIAGSTEIGDNVIIGGQTGIAGHLKIGNSALISSQSGIGGNVANGEQIGGNPSAPLKQSIKIRSLIRRLPEFYQDLKNIKAKLRESNND